MPVPTDHVQHSIPTVIPRLGDLLDPVGGEEELDVLEVAVAAGEEEVIDFLWGWGGWWRSW